MKQLQVAGLVILCLIFLALAAYYRATPAGSLLTFMPGYEAGSGVVHTKHAIAALILAVGCGILVWFMSGKKKPTATEA